MLIFPRATSNHSVCYCWI